MRNRSISRRVTLIASISVFIFMSISLFTNFYVLKKNNQQKLEENSVNVVNRISNAFQYPLWNYNISEIEHIMELELETEFISGIVLYDVDSKILCSQLKTNDKQIVSEKSKENISKFKALFFKEGDIHYKKEKIGTVVIFFDDSGYRHELKGMLLWVFFAEILASIIIFLYINYRLKLVIVDPIVSLSKITDKVGEQQFSIQKEHDYHYEIDDLYSSIVRMAGQLKDSFGKIASQYSEIQEFSSKLEEKNEALKEEIEKRSKIEEDLILAKDKAEESDRLKSAFLANMSHEIRTPMNSILGFSELLSDPNYTDEDRREYIRIIQENGQNLLRLINDIIDISKLEANQFYIDEQEFELFDFLETVFKEFDAIKDQTKPDILLKSNIPHGESFWVEADRMRLRQVIMNLLSNALKFTDSGEIELKVEISTEEYIIRVKDSGIGIKEEDQSEIFHRFKKLAKRANKLFGGAGLGLTISDQIVNLMEGKIVVKSQFGLGSCFSLVFPNNKHEQVETKKEIMSEVKLGSESLSGNVLVVDDEKNNFRLMEILLKKRGLSVIHANDGLEALDVMKTNTNIDFIFMDIKMPNMDGYEALSAIQKMGVEIPVVAHTAHAMSDDEEKCLSAGFTAYLAKPVRKNKLYQILDKYL